MSGKRLRKTASGYSTQGKAKVSLNEFIRQYNERPDPGKRTAGQMLDAWLAHKKNKKIAASTYARYDGAVRVHLKPLLGHLVLEDLTDADIEESFIDAMNDEDYCPAGRTGSRYAHSRGLTSAGRARLYEMLRNALNWSVKKRWITRNPISVVDPPQEINARGVAWTPQQAACFLDKYADDPMGAAWHLVLITAARRGEVAGMR